LLHGIELENELLLQTQLNELHSNLNCQNQAITSVNRFHQLNDELLNVTKNITQQQSQITSLSEKVVQMRVEYRQQKQQRDDVVLIVTQQKTIQSLAEHRNNLRPEQACPLCGSVDHPAIEQYQSIENSEQQQRLIELEQQLIELEQQGKS